MNASISSYLNNNSIEIFPSLSYHCYAQLYSNPNNEIKIVLRHIKKLYFFFFMSMDIGGIFIALSIRVELQVRGTLSMSFIVLHSATSISLNSFFVNLAAIQNVNKTIILSGPPNPM